MTGLEAASLYTALLILLFLGLKLNVGRARLKAKVSMGDGGDEGLIRAMRTQMNAVEDVPIILLGIFGLAFLEAPVQLVHGLGGGLVAMRLAHAVGLGGLAGAGVGRAIGTLGTAIIMVATAGSCIWFAVA